MCVVFCSLGVWQLHSCMGDNNAAFRSILLDQEDLSVAVERRLVGSRQSGDGLRLSYMEATQLAFLVAPCNPTGQISRREVPVSLETQAVALPLAFCDQFLT